MLCHPQYSHTTSSILSFLASFILPPKQTLPFQSYLKAINLPHLFHPQPGAQALSLSSLEITLLFKIFLSTRLLTMGQLAQD